MPAEAVIGRLRYALWKLQRLLLFKKSPKQFARQTIRMRVRRWVIRALHL
jgi:hypothetical protein